MKFLTRTLIASMLACTALFPAALSHAQEHPVVQTTTGVTYQLLEQWDANRLNAVLTTSFPEFAGIPVSYTPARGAVNLYRVTYPSVIPERDNKPTIASGLLAVPAEIDGPLPLVSYQHGTVYGKEEVPSFLDQSPETQAMVAQFAAQGYILIGADYFGMGTSAEPEGYMVKGSHRQAAYDMLMASRAVLADLKIETTGELYLSGWSQGGFVTMALLEKLEKAGVAVKAAATASAPTDIFAALNGFMNFPREIDAAWTPSLFVLSAFAFENYYGVPGLARSVIKNDVFDLARDAYEKKPVDFAKFPTELIAVVNPHYFDTQFFAASAYGRLARQTEVYSWIYRTPLRNYYGESDEAISVGLGRLAAEHQHAAGSGNRKVEAISTGPTTHRGTFATALPQWKIWFDGLAD